ncbi:carboxylating nicotinate-nucleotide diphosphorylase [Spirochaeta thermophila]|nr:carboxylating nicotinate-nucleotide diphosphorylase [Spirochaeta thermophila]
MRSRMKSLQEMYQRELEDLISLALEEDLGEEGDVTSKAIFPPEAEGAARVVSKGEGILAGDFVFERVFRKINERISVSFLRQDGDVLSRGDVVAELSGPMADLLTGERIALNFLAFLSGIATYTSKFVKEAGKSGHTVILDTRKTLPGFRRLSKYAVRIGGGENHRMGLYDMVLIKDNHIDGAGSITKAVERVRERWGDRFKIEVECRTVEEVEEALGAGVHIIMLDNMSPSEMEESIRRGRGKVLFECSGDMDLPKIAEVSKLGVDYISVGRITHSAPAFDFSMKVVAAG